MSSAKSFQQLASLGFLDRSLFLVEFSRGSTEHSYYSVSKPNARHIEEPLEIHGFCALNNSHGVPQVLFKIVRDCRSAGTLKDGFHAN